MNFPPDPLQWNLNSIRTDPNRPEPRAATANNDNDNDTNRANVNNPTPEPARSNARALVAYAWTAPTTAVGLLAGALTLATGGRCRRARGTLEFHGGFSTWMARKFGFGAMTLGHVIVGRDPRALEICRDHEHVHVRQAETLGPLFIPAYLAASLRAWAAGKHYYLDNPFEIEARTLCDEPDPRHRPPKIEQTRNPDTDPDPDPHPNPKDPRA